MQETGKSVRDVVLERGLLSEEELDDIFSVENLMHPRYKAKRYRQVSEKGSSGALFEAPIRLTLLILWISVGCIFVIES